LPRPVAAPGAAAPLSGAGIGVSLPQR